MKVTNEFFDFLNNEQTFYQLEKAGKFSREVTLFKSFKKRITEKIMGKKLKIL